MISQTETAGGAGQYGFYAIPKALEPKKKYRDNVDDAQYEGQQEQANPFSTIEDRIPQNQRELQRDYYVDEAPYPQFKPKERGLDYGVQIQRGDLFDFDLEIKPLIQILVGRSVVSAINQLQEEKEIEERRANLDKYQKKRNAELMVTQRLQAKHKRKLEQAQRRKLQKELYINNKKEAGKKLIARRNAKQSLLGLKKQIFDELEDSGYLRAEPTTDLKIKYQQWLYEKIMQALAFQAQSEKVAKKLIDEEEKRIANEHQKAISQELAKRQIILDQRQRIRKENEERRQKKRIKKMRQKLNAQREPQYIKFDQLLERYEQVTSILKFGDRSNGLSRNFNARPTVYISGGLDNYILALLQSSNKDLSAEQIEGFLIKIMVESGRQFEITLSAKHYDKVEQVKKRMNQNKAEFMKEKGGQVKDLAQDISLDLSLLEATNTPIRSSLHNRFIQALLSIYLTVQPQKSEENPAQLQEIDKKRLQFAQKIIISREQANLAQRIQNINEVLRVHFQIPATPVNSEATEQKPEQQEQEEWFDIYDGEGWLRRQKQAKKQSNKAEQVGAAYSLGTFQNSFVYDERVLHYLQIQLEKLLQITTDDKLKKYVQNLSNIRSKLRKDVAVYDGQVRYA